MFRPHLNILPLPQRQLWDELGALRALGCVLYGGTGVALHLGHRQSIDFDLFIHAPLDADLLLRDVAFLSEARVLQKSVNTLVCLLERDGPVQVSFFGVEKLPQLEVPIPLDNGISLASIVDLAGTKAAVVQKRSEAKDYIDLAALISPKYTFATGKLTLVRAWWAARKLYGETLNPEISLKALCYYGDGNLAKVPDSVREQLKKAVAAVRLEDLAMIEDGSLDALFGRRDG